MKNNLAPLFCEECVEFFMCKAHNYGDENCTYHEEIERKIVEGKIIMASDIVNEPTHYKQGTFECIDEMIIVFGVKNTIQFCRMNAWKYRARAPFKGNPEQDMAKANRYLEMAAELESIYSKGEFKLLKGGGSFTDGSTLRREQGEHNET